MPEGDTIFRTAAVLRSALVGQRVVAARARPGPGLRRVPDLSRVVGATVTSVAARGKHLLIGFDNGLTLRSHLRMRGSWHRYRPGEPWRLPASQANAVLETAVAVAVAFNTPSARAPDRCGPAPDPAAARARAGPARRRVRRRRGRPPASRAGPRAARERAARPASGRRHRQRREERDRLHRADGPVGVRRRLRRRRASRGRCEPLDGCSRRTRGAERGSRPAIPAADRSCGSTAARAVRVADVARAIETRRQGELARSTYWCPRCQPPRAPTPRSG